VRGKVNLVGLEIQLSFSCRDCFEEDEEDQLPAQKVQIDLALSAYGNARKYVVAGMFISCVIYRHNSQIFRQKEECCYERTENSCCLPQSWNLPMILFTEHKNMLLSRL
jgi:hypothetical protein